MSSPSAASAPVEEPKVQSPSAVFDSAPETAKDERVDDDGTAVEAGELSEDAESEASENGAESADKSPGEASSPEAAQEEAPPLPNEAVPNGPPLPNEPIPQKSEDDGWDCQWDPNSQSWFFYNRFTGKTQWDNPRVPDAGAATASQGVEPQPPSDEKPIAGGYNPAIHGDYDPNAWYAKNDEADESASAGFSGDPAAIYDATVSFNRFTGAFQSSDAGPERHSDEAKTKRQMNAFFDVDAAANAHGGRSLKAERSNKKPTKNELKAFKEKRRARKEEKRRAWLRD